jgi:predicted O-methyltransferase YrrM
VLGESLPAPLAGNRAWLYARRAEREFAAARAGHALACAMSALRLAPANPAARAVIEWVRRRVEPILPAVDAVELVRSMEEVEGWLTAAEATLLARAVAATPLSDGACVVEIGSYHGRSTLVIALAIAASKRPLRLIAIDPHVGYAFSDGSDTYESLMSTLRAHGVEAPVDVVRAQSVDVPLDRPIGMAFIDGLHDRAAVSADHAHLAPHVVNGGLVLFHDYVGEFPGVVDVVNDLLTRDSYELVAYTDSLVALRRI